LKVECDTINNILEENNITNIDYCSIDTEGSEYEILLTLDFSKFAIKVLDVEVNYPASEEARKIVELLSVNGFRLVGQLGCDFVFEHI